MNESCMCAVDRSGSDAGCMCVTLEETKYGPRFFESVRGDSRLASAQAAFDAEQVSAAKGGSPAGAMTAQQQVVERRAFHTCMTAISAPALVEPAVDPTDDGSQGGPPVGAMTAATLARG